ncbi:hypothetical protein GGF31_000764 [Allomyces arbusculus]|nr:hypothetical protein GGF31_000764 [Allomyces arbusculus]
MSDKESDRASTGSTESDGELESAEVKPAALTCRVDRIKTSLIKSAVPVYFAEVESSPVKAMWQRLPAGRVLPTRRLSWSEKLRCSGLGFDLKQFDGLSLEGADDVTTWTKMDECKANATER